MTEVHLLLDVDGPLNPYSGGPNKPEGYVKHMMRPSGSIWEDERSPALPVWLNASHGAKLEGLGYHIIWATTWQKDASTWIAPHVGLPTDLETIVWDDVDTSSIPVVHSRLYWKTREIAAYMKLHHPNEPFIWVDDEAYKADERFLKLMIDAELKIFTINPAKGLQNSDFEAMKTWRESLTT